MENKQALQEIKEIAESKKYIGFCKVDDILQKINEVDNGNKILR